MIGVSGGPDSICLLDILLRLRFKLIVAHLNHQLRPAAAKEEQFIQAIAKAKGLEFISKSVDIARIASSEGKGIEETARRERYQFLFKAGENYGADVVAVAHQADDQVETILMNFIRGAGLNGLTGMQYRSFGAFSKKVPLIRPLLDIWREDILSYCEENHLGFMRDESNVDTAYMRNRVRHKLIPEFKSYNPNIKMVLIRMRETLCTDLQYLEEIAQEKFFRMAINEGIGKVSIRLESSHNLAKSIQRMVVKKVFKHYFAEVVEIDLNLIEAARSFLNREVSTTSIILNERILIFVENGLAVITDRLHPENEIRWFFFKGMQSIKLLSGAYAINKKIELLVDIVPVEKLPDTYSSNLDNFTAFLDRTSLGDELIIRTWKAGDRYAPLGMGGRGMKVSDFWINKKIPKHARENWPLVYSQAKLIWIPGFQPSQFSRITDQTQSVVLLRLREKQ